MVDPTPQNERQTLRATGTNDQDSLPPIRHSVLVARMVARADEKTGFRVMTADESEADKGSFDRNAKRPENQGVCEPLRTADQRRGWDLNPRGTYAPAGFQDRCNRPLCHLSEGCLGWGGILLVARARCQFRCASV